MVEEIIKKGRLGWFTKNMWRKGGKREKTPLTRHEASSAPQIEDAGVPRVSRGNGGVT